MGDVMAVNRLELGEDWGQLTAIHDDLVSLLEQLDALGLHHAAAHVASALDSLRRDRPQIAPSPETAG